MALSFKPSVIIISDTNPDRKGLKACQDIRADCRNRNDSHPDPLRPQRGGQTSFKASELVQTIISPYLVILKSYLSGPRLFY